ncbi:MAG: ketopantoate reductase family protein [Elusimicrobia bacterium]|nr:ketopantoate reductase family protein [Elusimicrobiota bacterium]
MRKNRIAVVGSGVVGSILAAHLLRNKEEVILSDSLKRRLDRITEKGLSILDPTPFTHGPFTVEAKEACLSMREAARRGAETIFICVKAPAIQSLLAELRGICRGPRRVRVVSFQNGLDTEELLARAAGRENVLRAVVNYAGRLDPGGAVEITFFNKPNYIGALETAAIPYARTICGTLTRAGLDTEYSPKIKRQVWEKVILNSMLCPVSALTGMTMRQVMECAQTRELVMELAGEAIEVARRSGVCLPEKFLDFCVSYLTRAGDHKPSMLVDMETTGRTEIEFLNGKVCEYGAKNKAPVPFHRAVSALIKGLESRKRLR